MGATPLVSVNERHGYIRLLSNDGHVRDKVAKRYISVNRTPRDVGASIVPGHRCVFCQQLSTVRGKD
jgi:hypothetical protein